MTIASQIQNDRNEWDYAGVCSSFLCVLHCLVTPLLITVLPVLSATERQTNGIFAIIVLLVGMLAFIPGYQKHKRKLIPALGVLGASSITLAALLPELNNAELVETCLVLAGGTTLIYAHLRNAFWCRFCNKCSDDCCDITAPENS